MIYTKNWKSVPAMLTHLVQNIVYQLQTWMLLDASCTRTSERKPVNLSPILPLSLSRSDSERSNKLVTNNGGGGSLFWWKRAEERMREGREEGGSVMWGIPNTGCYTPRHATHNFLVACTLCFEVKWFLKNRNGSQLNLSYITRNWFPFILARNNCDL